MPIRIQRKRTKGWKNPPGTVYAGRRKAFGNPFPVDKYGHAQSVQMFEKWLDGDLDGQFPELIDDRRRLLEKLHELAGRDLSCFCPPNKPCHVDVLLRLANPEGTIL